MCAALAATVVVIIIILWWTFVGCRLRGPCAHERYAAPRERYAAGDISEINCAWPAGASHVPLNSGRRVWGPVGGFDAAVAAGVYPGVFAGIREASARADRPEPFANFGHWGPGVNPFENFDEPRERYVAGDPRTADTERENMRAATAAHRSHEGMCTGGCGGGSVGGDPRRADTAREN